MSEIISVTEALIALANLIVIIYFTRKERKENRERERESHKEKRSEMIFDIVVKRLFDITNKYFDEVFRMVDEFYKKPPQEKKNADISPLYNQFQREESVFRHMILSVLQSLNEESERDVREILDQYQNLMGNQFESKFRNKWETSRCIDESRVKVMKVLLKIEL